MFFATFASTVALGVVVDDKATGTNNCMGVTELLLSLSIAGMLHSIFSGCPMAVLRPTGPITLFTIKLYGLAQALNVDFFSWFAWVGLWVGECSNANNAYANQMQMQNIHSHTPTFAFSVHVRSAHHPLKTCHGGRWYGMAWR